MFTIALAADKNFRNLTVFTSEVTRLIANKPAVLLTYNPRRTSSYIKHMAEELAAANPSKVTLATTHPTEPAKLLKSSDALIAFWDKENEWTERTVIDFRRTRKPVAIVDYKTKVAALNEAKRAAYLAQKASEEITAKIEGVADADALGDAISQALDSQSFTLETFAELNADGCPLAAFGELIERVTEPKPSKEDAKLYPPAPAAWVKPSATFNAVSAFAGDYAQYKKMRADLAEGKAEQRALGAGSGEGTYALEFGDDQEQDLLDQTTLDRVKEGQITPKEAAEFLGLPTGQLFWVNLPATATHGDLYTLAIKGEGVTALTVFGMLDMKRGYKWVCVPNTVLESESKQVSHPITGAAVTVRKPTATTATRLAEHHKAILCAIVPAAPETPAAPKAPEAPAPTFNTVDIVGKKRVNDFYSALNKARSAWGKTWKINNNLWWVYLRSTGKRPYEPRQARPATEQADATNLDYFKVDTAHDKEQFKDKKAASRHEYEKMDRGGMGHWLAKVYELATHYGIEANETAFDMFHEGMDPISAVTILGWNYRTAEVDRVVKNGDQAESDALRKKAEKAFAKVEGETVIVTSRKIDPKRKREARQILNEYYAKK